jgi:hypothetical protein
MSKTREAVKRQPLLIFLGKISNFRFEIRIIPQIFVAASQQNFSLMLSMGIRYGLPSVTNIVKQKVKSGCGTIVALV